MLSNHELVTVQLLSAFQLLLLAKNVPFYGLQALVVLNHGGNKLILGKLVKPMWIPLRSVSAVTNLENFLRDIIYIFTCSMFQSTRNKSSLCTTD